MAFEYIKHELYPDSILIRNFTGCVDVQDIIDSWEYLIENKLITKSIKGIINNLEDCALSMDFLSFSTLLTYMKKQEALKDIKLAAICDSPQKIVFPTLAGIEVSELKIKPFSTIKAAENWIMFD